MFLCGELLTPESFVRGCEPPGAEASPACAVQARGDRSYSIKFKPWKDRNTSKFYKYRHVCNVTWCDDVKNRFAGKSEDKSVARNLAR